MPKQGRVQTGPLLLRAESSKLLLPPEVAARVQNMEPTEEGTLRSIRGPSPYVPEYGQGPGYPNYGRMHGIGHGVLRDGEREILLIHTADQIWVWEGWNKTATGPGPGWRVLLGPAASNPQRVASIADDRRPRFPTQFEFVAGGVVIVPQGGRAHFYDGFEVLTLGYAHTPAAPVGYGPESVIADESFPKPGAGVLAVSGVNEGGYAHDRRLGFVTAMNQDFGECRLGTVYIPPGIMAKSNPPNNGIKDDFADRVGASTYGILENSAWRAAYQWQDRWGNLSPLSGESNEVQFASQLAMESDLSGGVNKPIKPARADSVRKQIAWASIEPGPEGTIGRIISRTKELRHAGTTKLFRVPVNATAGVYNTGTLPDNVSTIFPDNIPDAWLGPEPYDVVPIPSDFRLCREAFGRLFIADKGKLMWSMPGRWGTFLREDFVYPDPTGDEITGMWKVNEGMLVFTEASTFLLRVNNSGDGFRSSTLHPEVGCSAPNSIKTMANGATLWLGREGFYQYDGTTVMSVTEDFQRFVRNINKARRMQAAAVIDSRRGEYRCWIAVTGSQDNNIAGVYDGDSWKHRIEMNHVADVCRTKDHRAYVLAAGRAEGSFPIFSGQRSGVWLLDHENFHYNPIDRVGIIETCWLKAADSLKRSSATTIYLWFRETSSSVLYIDVFRDWRRTVVETVEVNLYPTDDIPPMFDSTLLSGNVTQADRSLVQARWNIRRPYWTKADVHIGGAEVFKFRLRSTGDWDFFALAFDDIPKGDHGARVPSRVSS